MFFFQIVISLFFFNHNSFFFCGVGLTKEHVLRILVISMVCVLAIASGFWCGKCIYLGASSKKKLKGKRSLFCN